MRHVFICHASEDRTPADQIVEALEAGGVTCWIAPRDVGAGEDYAAAIVTALESVNAMVLVMSVAANDSPHIRREVERAASLGKTIIPIRLQAVDPSKSLQYYISDAQWFNAFDGRVEDHLPRFVADVAARLVAVGVMPAISPAGPGADEQAAVAGAIASLVERYGPGLAEEPRRVRALLMDLAGDSPTLAAAAVAAAEIGVGSELAGVAPAMQAATRVKLVHRLQRERALTAEMSQWAVDAWAEAVTVERAEEPEPQPAVGKPLAVEEVPAESPAAKTAAPPTRGEPVPAVPEAPPAETAAVIPPPVEPAPTPPRGRGSKRRWVVAGVALVVAAAAVGVGLTVFSGGCGPNVGAPPVARTTDTVAMRGADPGNSNDFGDNLAPSGPRLKRRWCSQDDNRFSQVAVSVGVVYAQGLRYNRVALLDAATGVATGTLAAADDIALVGDRLYTSGSAATSVDLGTGAELWRFDPSGVMFAPPVVAGDAVLLVESDESETLWVLDAATGEVRWSKEGLDIDSFDSVAIGRGMVVVPERDSIRTFDITTGALRLVWEGELFSGVVAVGDTVLVVTSDGLVARDLQDLTLKWESGSFTEMPAVAVDERVVLGLGFENSQQTLRAFDLDTGAQVWSLPTGLAGSSSRQRPSIAAGVAYSAVDSTIFAVDVETGTLLWSDGVGVDVYSEIAIADGLLIFQGDDGKIHAFGDR